MLRFVVPAVLALAASLSAQTAFFPLKDVRPGMRGVGRTIFSGNHIDEFQVEVLGVLDNMGPKESLILARLSGGPLEHTGVLEGMSGSPVYIEGKLAGAVAMAFPYAKDPIAGIRPIEEMVGRASPPATARRPTVALLDRDLLSGFPKPEAVPALEGRMINIATPVSFGGFSRGALEAFAPQLRSLGLEPRQSVSGGANVAPGMGDPAALKPGSMISVQLMSGDLSVGADGVVTYIDGKRVYAFGHRFLAVGGTALPFARAEVVALIPTLSNSFKLSVAKEWMGSIYQDCDTAISGEVGKLPEMTPVTISVSRNGRPVESYNTRMVNDPLLSPMLLQMAIFSVIDATERTVGAASIRVSGEMEFRDAPAPIRIADIYAMDNGAAQQAALSAAIPAAYVLQSGYEALGLKRVKLNIEAYDQKKQLTIDGVTVSRREARAGDTVTLNVSLAGANGFEITRQASYRIPASMEPGTLNFTVADANVTNLADFRQIVDAPNRSPAQVIDTVNGLHPNNKAFIRIWRDNPSFQLEGTDLPDPPPSAALILGSSQSSQAGIGQTRNARLAQIEVDAGDMAVTGSKTIQVEVKE